MACKITAWFLTCAALHFFALSASAQSNDRSARIEAAKKEGKLNWYTATSLDESKPLLEDFESLYPFVKGDLLRASAEKTLNRIAIETRAGKWDFDLATLSEVDALMENKLLGRYVSPEAKN